MSGPSDKAIRAVFDRFHRLPDDDNDGLTYSGAELILGAAHDIALGSERSIRARDVIDWLESQDWVDAHTSEIAHAFEQEFCKRGPRRYSVTAVQVGEMEYKIEPPVTLLEGDSLSVIGIEELPRCTRCGGQFGAGGHGPGFCQDRRMP